MTNNENNETKYMNCYKKIANYIKDNNLSEGDKLPTEKQLTDMLQVSRITVRKAISVLEENGIVKSVHGSGTFVGGKNEDSKQITYIPLILPGEAEDGELFDAIRGVNKYLSEKLCYLTLHFSHRNPKEERSIINKLVADGAKCIMIFLCDESENQWFFSKLERKGIRFVFLDRIPENVSGSIVRCDNFKGGYMATKHLIQQGCKRIAFLSRTAEPEAHSLTQRLNGYREALKENSIEYKEEYVSFDRPSVSIQERLEELLSLPERPDAFFCANDLAAIDTMYTLERHSLAVPADVAVMGFDNSNVLNNLPFSISTIGQSFYDIGYEAAEIVSRILDGSLNYDVHKILPVELIVRDSTLKK